MTITDIGFIARGRNYKDFFELGAAGNFIKMSKMKAEALDKEELKKFNNRVSRQISASVSIVDSRSVVP